MGGQRLKYQQAKVLFLGINKHLLQNSRSTRNSVHSIRVTVCIWNDLRSIIGMVITIRVFCWAWIVQHTRGCAAGPLGLQLLPCYWRKHIERGRSQRGAGEGLPCGISMHRLPKAEWECIYGDVFLLLGELDDPSEGWNHIDVDAAIGAIGVLERHLDLLNKYYSNKKYSVLKCGAVPFFGLWILKEYSSTS